MGHEGGSWLTGSDAPVLGYTWGIATLSLVDGGAVGVLWRLLVSHKG
jgi:hypothetical protein